MIETPNDAITDLDLADLTELDLGGCASFGAARVSELHQALQGGEDACEIGPPEGPMEGPCLPFYRPKDIGCIIIPVVIEEEGDEG